MKRKKKTEKKKKQKKVLRRQPSLFLFSVSFLSRSILAQSSIEWRRAPFSKNLVSFCSFSYSSIDFFYFSFVYFLFNHNQSALCRNSQQREKRRKRQWNKKENCCWCFYSNSDEYFQRSVTINHGLINTILLTRLCVQRCSSSWLHIVRLFRLGTFRFFLFRLPPAQSAIRRRHVSHLLFYCFALIRDQVSVSPFDSRLQHSQNRDQSLWYYLETVRLVTFVPLLELLWPNTDRSL